MDRILIDYGKQYENASFQCPECGDTVKLLGGSGRGQCTCLARFEYVAPLFNGEQAFLKMLGNEIRVFKAEYINR